MLAAPEYPSRQEQFRLVLAHLDQSPRVKLQGLAVPPSVVLPSVGQVHWLVAGSGQLWGSQPSAGLPLHHPVGLELAAQATQAFGNILPGRVTRYPRVLFGLQ